MSPSSNVNTGDNVSENANTFYYNAAKQANPAPMDYLEQLLKQEMQSKDGENKDDSAQNSPR